MFFAVVVVAVVREHVSVAERAEELVSQEASVEPAVV